MPKQGNESEEGFGPQLDGLKEIENLQPDIFLPAMEEPAELELPVPFEEEENSPALLPDDDPVVLIFGTSEEAQACARLAAECGFMVEVAANSEDAESLFPWTDNFRVLPEYLDIVEHCGIDRNFFVCIFEPDLQLCETILTQCLASRAAYLGVFASREERDQLYAMLKADGAPDAELAAVCCPMGLAIGAENPEQNAVGIVAEMLSARAGTLKRLRYDD